MFQSLILETVNCSSIDSCKAMTEIHSYMSEVCESETEKSLRAAGFVMVDMNNEEIEYSVSIDVVF